MAHAQARLSRAQSLPDKHDTHAGHKPRTLVSQVRLVPRKANSRKSIASSRTVQVRAPSAMASHRRQTYKRSQCACQSKFIFLNADYRSLADTRVVHNRLQLTYETRVRLCPTAMHMYPPQHVLRCTRPVVHVPSASSGPGALLGALYPRVAQSNTLVGST